jgi:hypothetical protein
MVSTTRASILRPHCFHMMHSYESLKKLHKLPTLLQEARRGGLGSTVRRPPKGASGRIDRLKPQARDEPRHDFV